MGHAWWSPGLTKSPGAGGGWPRSDSSSPRTSRSAKPATTSSFFRFSIVTKPELLLDELVAAPPVLDAAPVLPVPLEELGHSLLPEVVPAPRPWHVVVVLKADGKVLLDQLAGTRGSPSQEVRIETDAAGKDTAFMRDAGWSGPADATSCPTP